MAKLTGGGRLDMRELLFLGEIAAATATRIEIAWEDRAARFEGGFGYTDLGLPTGTLSGFSIRAEGRTVLTATAVDRSAYTAIGIARTGDNDRFLAYVLSGDDRIEGTSAADYLLGFGGDDLVMGGRGDDMIFGGAGRDRLHGGAGDDLLAGGEGVDRLEGGAGDDEYAVDRAGDRVVEARGGGHDRVTAAASFTLPAHVEDLGLTGAKALDGTGNALANAITGNAAANVLRGMDGDDALAGLPGDDVLIGGLGRDLLSGGRGDDVYRFLSLAESGAAPPRRDHILDFWRGEDRIDFSALDADPARPGRQAPVWRGEGAFSGAAGELRVSHGKVRIDADGDRAADFAIDLTPLILLQRDDFIL